MLDCQRFEYIENNVALMFGWERLSVDDSRRRGKGGDFITPDGKIVEWKFEKNTTFPTTTFLEYKTVIGTETVPSGAALYQDFDFYAILNLGARFDLNGTGCFAGKGTTGVHTTEMFPSVISGLSFSGFQGK